MNRTLIENHILKDMQAVDNAHFYFDKNLSEKMEEVLRKLITYYKENPHIAKWDLQKIKAKMTWTCTYSTNQIP